MLYSWNKVVVIIIIIIIIIITIIVIIKIGSANEIVGECKYTTINRRIEFISY